MLNLFEHDYTKGGPFMYLGKVKWFFNAKGYGFIVPDDQDLEVFVHFSTIGGNGPKTLRNNQRVQFELQQSHHGWHTTRVLPVEREEETQ